MRGNGIPFPQPQGQPLNIAAPLNDLQFAGLLAAILVAKEPPFPKPAGVEVADHEEYVQAHEQRLLASAAKRASHLMLHVAFEHAVGSFGAAIEAGMEQGKARLEARELERRAALEQKPAEPEDPNPLIITEEGA